LRNKPMATFGLAMLTALASADIKFRVTEVTPPCWECDDYVAPGGISNNGAFVCGNLDRLQGPRANRWEAATRRRLDLGRLPDCFYDSLDAWAVNELGWVTGWAAGCPGQTWLWKPETGIVGLGFDASAPRAMNVHGQIAGTMGNSSAFRWDPVGGLTLFPGFTAAFDINDAGVVVGSSGGNAVIWHPNGQMQTLINNGAAQRMNGTGQVMGVLNSNQLFIWDPVTGVEVLPSIGGFLEPIGFSDDGMICGQAPFPFIWDRQRGFRDVSAMLDPCSIFAAAVPLNQLYLHDMAADGTIVANAQYYEGPWTVLTLRAYLPGDIAQDGRVDLADLSTLVAGYGLDSGDPNEPLPDEVGNTDCDTDVDLADLATLLTNFGQSLP
jgi:hypothetical protein